MKEKRKIWIDGPIEFLWGTSSAVCIIYYVGPAVIRNSFTNKSLEIKLPIYVKSKLSDIKPGHNSDRITFFIGPQSFDELIKEKKIVYIDG